MLDLTKFDSLNETKYYTKLRLGLIRYNKKFEDITFSQELTDQFPKLIDKIKSIHMVSGMKEGLLHLQKSGWLKVYTIPVQQFVFLRRDMVFTYPDLYNLKLEGSATPRDTVSRVDTKTGEFQIIVPNTTTQLADGILSRIISRQLHHEVGHFVYEDIKDSYYVKNRLVFQFYKKLFFESPVFAGGDSDKNKNRWLFIIKRFLVFTKKLNDIEVESLSLSSIRMYQNRIKILFDSFDGFIGDALDVDYIEFLESLFRKIINIDEDVMSIVSDSIRDIYKDLWVGSFTGARIHKDTKYYQELYYPNEILARMMEGSGRNMSNQIYRTIAIDALKQYPNLIIDEED